MENIDVIVGTGIFKAGREHAFSVIINGCTHIVKFKSRRQAELRRQAEENNARIHKLTKNVKRFFENDIVYPMAASHELNLIAD
jgi:hypothetical protein